MPYQNSVPDYMRVNEFFLDRRNTKFPDRIAVLDKFNSWITVDSKTLNRKECFENKTKNLDLRKTSSISPDWMQN